LPAKQNKAFWAKLGLFFITTVWGSSFVIMKDITSVLPLSYIIVFRFSLAAVLLSLIFHRRLTRLSRTELIGGIVIGFFTILGYEFQTYGLEKTTAGNSALLTAVYCVIVPFLYWFVKKKKPGAHNIVSAFLCLIGVGVLSLTSGFSINPGDVLSLLCGLSFAAQIVAIDIFTEKGDPILLSIVQLATTAILALPIALCFETLPSSVGTDTVCSALYLALFCTLITYLLQMVCQQYVAPSQSALIMSLESVIGALCGVLFLHEAVSVRMLFGCVLIFAAVTLSERQPDVPQVQEAAENASS
jgi:drug/metabolite transporter (DMT)-like permease